MTTRAGTRRGTRDGRKEAFWRRGIAEQAGSGRSVRAWCAGQRVREASFYWWRRQLARRDAERPTLVPVRVTHDSPTRDASTRAAVAPLMVNVPHGRMEIVLPDRHRVRIIGPVDRQALCDVLGVLRAADFRQAEAPAC